MSDESSLFDTLSVQFNCMRYCVTLRKQLKTWIISEVVLTTKQGRVRKYAMLKHIFNEGLPGKTTRRKGLGFFKVLMFKVEERAYL